MSDMGKRIEVRGECGASWDDLTVFESTLMRRIESKLDALVFGGEGASRASMGDGPIPMFLTCPKCNVRHIDEGEFATKPHHTHSCQGCGLTWRPAVVATVGVAFLPGFKNEAQATTPPSEPLSNWAARNGVDSRDL